MKIPAWLARDLVYGLQERACRRPTFPYLAELERSQWLSHADVQRLQLAKLRKLLAVAFSHAPWHRARMERAGLRPDSVASLEDLRKLPCMDKQDAAAHKDEIVWRGVPGGAFKYNTGGSSGQPLIFHFGRLRQASDAAGRMRARRWWGVEPGQREAYLWGAPVELNKTDWVKTLRDRLINQLVLNAFAMSPARMDDYLDATRGLSSALPVRIRQFGGPAGGSCEAAQALAATDAAEGGVHHRRAAVRTSARLDWRSLRRTGGE